MLQKTQTLAKEILPQIQNNYRHLHAHPELSYREFETSKYVQQQLDRLGIPYETGFGGTGILARIESKNPASRIIALRADMDALPIQEETGLPWKSKNEGVMHACGHDAHTSSLLGAAEILMQIKDSFEGTILLIFQPGEERAPGGASLMLKDGVFDKYQPEIIIGQHTSEDYPTGSFAFRSGIVMASADEIYITIRGTGGHGAKPHLVNDTVLAASQTIVSLQQVASRLCPPLVPMVLTFGKFIAEGSTNVIPAEVKIEGTFRTYDEKWRAEAKTHIRRIVAETAAAYGCTAEVEIPEGYPSLINDDKTTEKARQFAIEFVGEERVDELDQRLTSEDFAFFSQAYPACFYRFGIHGKENANAGKSHTSTYQIDEASLEYGAGGMAWIAYRFMR